MKDSRSKLSLSTTKDKRSYTMLSLIWGIVFATRKSNTVDEDLITALALFDLIIVIIISLVILQLTGNLG